MGDMEDIIHEEEEEDRDDGKLSLIPQHFLMQGDQGWHEKLEKTLLSVFVMLIFKFSS